ncbi:hypothetical protein B0H14DRAFT_2606020 [Mycena olivaceomarginata]|nr:hypothetical protein B0H14DRAFT_2606020 [Mycena olivaceomarginata]
MSSSPKSSVCMIGWIASSMVTLQPLPPRGIPGDWPGTAPTGLHVHQPLPLPLPSLPSATPAYHLPTPFLRQRTPPTAMFACLWSPMWLSGTSLAVAARAYTRLMTSPAPSCGPIPTKPRRLSAASLSKVPTSKSVKRLLRLGSVSCGSVFTPRRKVRHPSEDPAPPPAGPVPAPPRAAMDIDPPPRHQAHPPAPGKLAQDLHPHDDGGLRPAAVGAQGPLTSRVRFAPQQSSPPPLQPLPREPATTAPIAPTQVTAPPNSTLRPNSTPFVPLVTMSTPLPTGGLPTVYGSPMLIDTVATGLRRRRTQIARRGGTIPAHSARVVGDNVYFPGDPEY